uniref:Uncharacterized protein n=1 Tax=Kwoniella dejecticola CBS 10117 TaxID=1296121 RepID=A0A1A6A1Z5_9TREE|nr:uncharacterized protein I303_04938 [Kwoniella dejecticola CBS 10117]OBR84081.1 hypothetical protein I303_04938 [Kwoniella dejecticola CBS 10117]
MDNPKTDIILSMAHTEYGSTRPLRNHPSPTSARFSPPIFDLRDGVLPEDGIGNKEYNENHSHKDWVGYGYAYKVESCYKLKKVITLEEMKSRYGINGAPRGMGYVTKEMMRDVKWDEQECVWTDKEHGQD